MGLPISRDSFSEDDFGRFSVRLNENLAALQALLERPGFGDGKPSLGAELEMSLVDAGGRALLINEAVLAASGDPKLDLEINRFNIECGTSPAVLAGTPFALLGGSLQRHVDAVKRAASGYGARPVLIGILPTLTADDLRGAAMTDAPRYRALANGLRRARGRPFRIRIDGLDPLEIESDDVAFEGANTSFQVHLRVSPGRFTDLYNAIQLVTAPALAAAANSPTFLGHRLWDETRIALFKQSVDDRGPGKRGRVFPRVGFGTGWLRDGPFPLFEESVRLHQPLLPVLDTQCPLECLQRGGTPDLLELRLHHGTVWRWNRAIYDPVDGGHLRVEMRAFPAGPTIEDMLANAAFIIGAATTLAESAQAWTAQLPFDAVQVNFYRAAQCGLDARLRWLDASGNGEATARDVALQLLPLARMGLASLGVDGAEAAHYLAIIAARVDSGRTGARWQRQRVDQLTPTAGRAGALTQMLDEYIELSTQGRPVSVWPWELQRR